ncbi:MAG: hydroxymyristoyl-ACP dehydratase [Flavobacteriaceae bacterium]|nr:hydroxymyristoyl-ACP dehydratase [Flavobacteriaceae bacterium]
MLLKDFYTVLHSKQVEGEFITEIRIHKDHRLYQGHFPGRPVTPGVVLMQLFKEEAERQFNCALELQKASNIKFMAVVDPNQGENFILQSNIQEENGSLKLKGIAQHNGCIALRINSIYKILP